MWKRNWAFGLAMGLATAWTGGASHADVIVYGIDNGNNIRAVDLTNKTESVIYSTGLSGTFNGVAISGTNLLFRNDVAGSGKLYSYDLTGVDGMTALSGSSLPGSSSNAAFSGGSYWYVQQNTSTLVAAPINFGASTIGSPTLYTSTNVTGSYGFGDIAIASNGMLYGSSNHGIQSVDLDIANPFTSTLNVTSTLYQIALNADESGLFLQSSNGNWYSMAFSGPNANTLENLNFNSTFLRDVSDIAVNAVPEPSSVVMLGLGGLVLAGRALRGRKNRAAVA